MGAFTIDDQYHCAYFDHEPPEDVADEFCVPRHCIGEVTFGRPFYRDYVTALEIVAAIFSSPSILPNPRSMAFVMNVRPEWVLDYVTGSSMDCSALGDGTWDEDRDEDERFAALPECANDLEFGIVRRRLGLAPRNPWRPCSAAPSFGGMGHSDDSDMDEDEDVDDVDD